MPALLRESRYLTLAAIAALTRSQLLPGQPVDRCISGIAPLDTAGSTDIAFLEDEKSLHQIAATHAGACFVASRFAASAPPPVAVLLNDEPYKAFVTTAQALFPDDIRPTSLFETAGRSADAHIHASSRIEAGVTIDPLAMIGPRAEVGTGTVLAAGVTLGPDVCVGRQCAIGAGATIMHALIGDGVVVQPGARIGHEGLGYRPDLKRQGRLFQCRRVIIQDDVQIGANAAVDRGSTRDTIIGEGTTIDNLVQIAHNAAIGRHCLIGAQAGIGGNVRVGDFVVIGRQSNVDDDSAIGDGIVLPERSWIRSDTSLGARSSSPSGRFGEGKA